MAPGDPTTTANEADVHIATSLTDVRNESDLSDYTGELELESTLRITDISTLRITDKYNSPDPSTRPFSDPATTVDLSFPVTVPCAATASATVGSGCTVATTANAVLAGVVTESRRTIWQMDQIKVSDGGADGVAATGDNTLFEIQGLFVP